MGGAARIYLLTVGVLLVLCTEVWTGMIRSIPAVFHSPPWSSKGVLIDKNPMSIMNKVQSVRQYLVYMNTAAQQYRRTYRRCATSLPRMVES